MTVRTIKEDAAKLLHAWKSSGSTVHYVLPQEARNLLEAADYSGFTHAMLDVIPPEISNREASTICYALMMSVQP